MNKQPIKFQYKGEDWTHQVEFGNTVIRNHMGEEILTVAGTDNTEHVEWALAGYEEGFKRGLLLTGKR